MRDVDKIREIIVDYMDFLFYEKIALFSIDEKTPMELVDEHNIIKKYLEPMDEPETSAPYPNPPTAVRQNMQHWHEPATSEPAPEYPNARTTGKGLRNQP